jgi:hypothetical protein
MKKPPEGGLLPDGNAVPDYLNLACGTVRSSPGSEAR